MFLLVGKQIILVPGRLLIPHFLGLTSLVINLRFQQIYKKKNKLITGWKKIPSESILPEGLEKGSVGFELTASSLDVKFLSNI